ncbi:unnamed protein product [Meganyctiphanes norvegica]|uniref:K Homology domain-containing protein n=1 Tax=Meganyctiphanes norvegica TaxID=48144 RepID=A0AAV2QYG4_MEGNR
MSSPRPTSRGASGGPPSPSLSEYLAGLLKDKRQLCAFPGVFHHMDRLLDDEIAKVRSNLFQAPAGSAQPLELPSPEGEKVELQEKLYVPVQDNPDFNFVGRILGPRGMTLKKLEQETGCKIMIRGKGSTRDKRREELNRGKPNWEHLTEELHVLVSAEDTDNRAQLKLKRAIEEVKQLLVPSQDNGDDELKKRQLMELAIINGTYRDTAGTNNRKDQPNQDPNMLSGEAAMLLGLMQAANQVPQHSAGALNIPQHLLLPPGMVPQHGAAMPPHTMAQSMHSMQPPPLVSAQDIHNNIMYVPFGDPNASHTGFGLSAAAMAQQQPQRPRKHMGHRHGPY